MFDAIRADWTLLLIPPIAAFIGWFTNWVAVKMIWDGAWEIYHAAQAAGAM